MPPVEIAAHAIGFVALVLSVISFQQNLRKRILIFLIFSTALFGVQYLMLKVYTGFAMNALGLIRTIIYYLRQDKKWASSNFWPCFFIALAAALTVLTWEGAISLLPLCGITLTGIGTWLTEPKIIRRFTLPNSLCWMAYNLIVGSYSGFASEIFTSSSVIIAMFRYDFRKKAVQEAELVPKS